MTPEIYGAKPADLGLIDLTPVEMMFWLYCPIKLPGEWHVTLPGNLRSFSPIFDRVVVDLNEGGWRESYVYLTAKTLHVTPENMGNRPGWHSDGFGTDDLNYIWQDRFPTEFMHTAEPFSVPQDHNESMIEMAKVAETAERVTYPVKHLLRLDQTAIHRVPVVRESGVRTFVKVSVSRDRYALAGNSINHGLTTDWRMACRSTERNHPQATEGAA